MWLILGVPILSIVFTVGRITDNNKRFWVSLLGTVLITGFTVSVHKGSVGRPQPSFHLKHGQTYEILNGFKHDGQNVVAIVLVNIHLSDCTYSRVEGGIRFYYVDGEVPTNRIVIAFTEGKWGYLRPVDSGTNEFHLSQ